MKVNFGAFWQGVKAVNKTARSVVSSDAVVSDSMEPVSKVIRAFTMAIITVLFTVVFVQFAGLVLASDGYLAGLVARVLAIYCVSSGQCDLHTTLPAFAIAIIILTDLVIYILATVMMFADQPEDSIINTITEQIDTVADGMEARFDDLATLIQNNSASERGGKE